MTTRPLQYLQRATSAQHYAISKILTHTMPRVETITAPVLGDAIGPL
jgi:hypothetical protein